jgi:hypothetical protein
MVQLTLPRDALRKVELQGRAAQTHDILQAASDPDELADPLNQAGRDGRELVSAGRPA